MDDQEKGLLRRQEGLIVAAARKALDGGKATEALSLVERTTEFWFPNLITLMSVIGFYQSQTVLVGIANRLFDEHLARCTNPNSLVFLVLWLRNPKRSRSLPQYLTTAIENHRKMLEPAWDGTWNNPGTAPTNIALTLLKKAPHEVSDPGVCLMVASQARHFGPWLDRYRALGGDQQSSDYLKLCVAKFVPTTGKLPYRIKGLLRKFTATGDVAEVRKFLRNITPIRDAAEGKSPNIELSRFALFLYCECERLERDMKDWVHISRSALYLRDTMIQRIVQRVLVESERDHDSQEVFEELVRRNGVMPVTRSPRNDIGSRGNSIWQNLHRLIPVNTDAAKILGRYSRQELDS